MPLVDLPSIWCRLQRFKLKLIEPCPAELSACEGCGHLACESKRWLQCERRVKTANLLQMRARTGGRGSHSRRAGA